MPAVFALAALAVPVCSLAQVPTLNSVVSTPTGSQSWQPFMPAAISDLNGDGKLGAKIAAGAGMTAAEVRILFSNSEGLVKKVCANRSSGNC